MSMGVREIFIPFENGGTSEGRLLVGAQGEVCPVFVHDGYYDHRFHGPWSKRSSAR